MKTAHSVISANENGKEEGPPPVHVRDCFPDVRDAVFRGHDVVFVTRLLVVEAEEILGAKHKRITVFGPNGINDVMALGELWSARWFLKLLVEFALYVFVERKYQEEGSILRFVWQGHGATKRPGEKRLRDPKSCTYEHVGALGLGFSRRVPAFESQLVGGFLQQAQPLVDEVVRRGGELLSSLGGAIGTVENKAKFDAMTVRSYQTIQDSLFIGIGGSRGKLADVLDGFFVEVLEEPVRRVDRDTVWPFGLLEVFRRDFEDIYPLALNALVVERRPESGPK